MRDPKKGRTVDSEHARTPVRAATPNEVPLPRGPIDLHTATAAGNAAIVQMLRQAGHPWARHQHGPGCGHGAEPPAEQPRVQRSAVHAVLGTSGRPLDDTTRTDMETRFGTDFSDVRIHDDGAAKASAAEVGARAYTSGSHVVIGEGGNDQHTLAHELTHVVQQRQGPVTGTDNGAGLSVSDPSDRFEKEAEANAVRVMRAVAVPSAGASGDPAGAPVRAAGTGPGVVQRAVRIGQPGLDELQTLDQLQQDQQYLTILTRHPWLQEPIRQLAESSVEYRFAAARNVATWAALKDAVDHLIGLEAGETDELSGGSANSDRWETAKKVLTDQQSLYRQAGESPGGGRYSLFGQGYNLEKLGEGHYYATKVGSEEPVLYQGRLTSGSLRGIVDALAVDSEYRPQGVTAQQVDEFVCACLAEPSRWRGEQVFNIFAENDQPPQPLTGQGAGALPMTTGSTWEPTLVQLGRETPTRALTFLNTVPVLRNAMVTALNKTTTREDFRQRLRKELFGT